MRATAGAPVACIMPICAAQRAWRGTCRWLNSPLAMFPEVPHTSFESAYQSSAAEWSSASTVRKAPLSRIAIEGISRSSFPAAWEMYANGIINSSPPKNNRQQFRAYYSPRQLTALPRIVSLARFMHMTASAPDVCILLISATQHA